MWSYLLNAAGNAVADDYGSVLLVSGQRGVGPGHLHSASFGLRSPQNSVDSPTGGTDGLLEEGSSQTPCTEGMFAFKGGSPGWVHAFQTDGTRFLFAFPPVGSGGAGGRPIRASERFLEEELSGQSDVWESPGDGDLRPTGAALEQKLREPSLQVLLVAGAQRNICGRQVRGGFLVEGDESLSDEGGAVARLGGVPWSEGEQQRPAVFSGLRSHLRLEIHEEAASCYSVELVRTLLLNVPHDGGGHGHRGQGCWRLLAPLAGTRSLWLEGSRELDGQVVYPLPGSLHPVTPACFYGPVRLEDSQQPRRVSVISLVDDGRHICDGNNFPASVEPAALWEILLYHNIKSIRHRTANKRQTKDSFI